MGRSQLQYNRRARGRGGGGGRGAAGAPSGRGGGGGRVASAKASQQAALRKLPSNQDRFQAGGGGGGEEGAGAGRRRSDEKGGDDLRAFALSTDSQLGHRHVLAEESADSDAPADYSSLSLDLGSLAEGLCYLPAHVRLGGVDPALTEGLMYRQGYPASKEEGEAPPKAPVKPVSSTASTSTGKATSVANAPSSASVEPPLEALLGLELSATTEKKKKEEEGGEGLTSTLPSDLDNLLNMGLSARSGWGGAAAGPVTAGGGRRGAPSAKDDDDLVLLDELLLGPTPPTSSVPAAASSRKKTDKLSALDAGDY